MDPQESYTPIACGLLDEVEASIVRRQGGDISYYDEHGALITFKGRAIDWRSREKGEFLILENGTEIRLDRVVSYLGKPFGGRVC